MSEVTEKLKEDILHNKQHDNLLLLERLLYIPMVHIGTAYGIAKTGVCIWIDVSCSRV